MNKPIVIVLRCSPALLPKVRYVFDTLFMARGIPVTYLDQPPSESPWLFYGQTKDVLWPLTSCLAIAHCQNSWRFLDDPDHVETATRIENLVTLFPETATGFDQGSDIPFDIVANAFYFLSSWSERFGQHRGKARLMYTSSIFVRLGIPQDIVDQYLDQLVNLLDAHCVRLGVEKWPLFEWPQNATYAIVLSHDVDFIPNGIVDIGIQGIKTVLRHLIRQRDPFDALRAAAGLALALIQRRDPYGCLPEIIEREKALGIYASFQVAVGHRHPNDVNYRIENDLIRDYLHTILDADFDLCLHGSYLSTENIEWYKEEAKILAQRLRKPLGSRQHFLSFDYDNLFTAQEQAGIQYDMSMGFSDRIGSRCGFSYPYFPYCIKEDRPYDVLELHLSLMDVTLRSYMNLKGAKAWEAIKSTLDDLRRKRGCVSTVWHPIVFGGARDPGFDRLFWQMVDYTRETSGFATDGRSINHFWRDHAKYYSSFNRNPSRSK